jgi:putative intracellular protease/amidase
MGQSNDGFDRHPQPRRSEAVVILASNPAVSEQTGWPIGFWWAELTHPYWEFTGHGYQVDVASPDGGALEADSWSDPRDESGYSADDLLSLGFINSPKHMQLVEESEPLADISVDAYDAILLVGGQGPMYTFWGDERVHRLLASFCDAGKVTAVICHATCVLLKTRLSDGTLLVDGKTWTGFATSEERYADDFVGLKIQPFWIEDQARKLEGANFLVSGRFRPHAVRDGNLITGQQQYSGRGGSADHRGTWHLRPRTMKEESCSENTRST